ncbi:bacteriorhodopsin [Halopiger djelfimassiliensis]|uniref:bacteriorhodopsin n=1 Tax=Halopiger djelfimassiliensis TaxID=1293047 RepID=UPI00067788BF|nr:bacteriorhodopsin [Halopiger djelfimassiliensis]
MIDIASLLAGSGAVLGAVALLFLAGSTRLPPACRRYGYAAVVAAGAMAITYLAMAAGELSGLETDRIRFLGYGVMWTVICFVAGAIAGADRRLTLTLVGVVQTRLWSTHFGLELGGILGQVLSLVALAALFAGIYLLFRPFMRAVESVSAERLLLYSKLRNLIVLAWAGLVAIGVLSGVGIDDDFVGSLSMIYIEVILLVGFGGILLRSVDALEDTAATSPLIPFSFGPIGTASDSTPETDAGVDAD